MGFNDFDMQVCETGIEDIYLSIQTSFPFSSISQTNPGQSSRT